MGKRKKENSSLWGVYCYLDTIDTPPPHPALVIFYNFAYLRKGQVSTVQSYVSYKAPCQFWNSFLIFHFIDHEHLLNGLAWYKFPLQFYIAVLALEDRDVIVYARLNLLRYIQTFQGYAV